MTSNWLKNKIDLYNQNKTINLINKLESSSKKIKEVFQKNPSKLLLNQLANPNRIPVIIINFNQLYYFKQLIDFLLKHDSKQIVVVDNLSTYKPLLEYYSEISKLENVKIEYQKSNLGHLVFWKNKKLYKKYSNGFFVITDADIVPNNKLGNDYLKIMLDFLIKYPEKTKIGFALEINNIPEFYPLKNNVLNWEKKFWEKQLEKDVYDAEIDTTFSLYWPKTNRIVNVLYPSFFNAIRIGGDFTALHGGWYLDHKKLTDEQIYYIKTSNNSNSWKVSEDGKLIGDFKDSY